MHRRTFLRGLLGTAALPVLAGTATTEAFAHHTKRRSRGLARKWLPQRVRFSGYRPGTIVVDPRNRFLYLVETHRTARRYGVGVGRAGLAFQGSATIGWKRKWPRWTPTANMVRREPQKYAKYRDGLAGGPNNPLGARALYLVRNGRDTYYRIHGTNQPWSIGQAVSSGCIRMLNAHISDLYDRVQPGARVIVV